MIRLWLSKLELIHYIGLNAFTLPPFTLCIRTLLQRSRCGLWERIFSTCLNVSGEFRVSTHREENHFHYEAPNNIKWGDICTVLLWEKVRGRYSWEITPDMIEIWWRKKCTCSWIGPICSPQNWTGYLIMSFNWFSIVNGRKKYCLSCSIFFVEKDTV